jgi:copper chaperone CopZ
MIAAACSGRAEFLKIEQSFGGMDKCASCSEFIQKKLTANPGVQSVEIDDAKRVVKVVLKPGNTVKLANIRDFVQQSGYEAKEAQVTVVGVPVVHRGITNLKIEGQTQTLRVKDDGGFIREFTNKKVEVEGVVQLVKVNETRLEVMVTTKGKLVP